MLNNMLRRITDNYKKNPNSNIGKLLNIFASELAEVQDALYRIDEWNDIDLAEGETLDRIGANVQQFRGVANDPIYRILIKSKIARNRSTGDINTIIDVLSVALDTDPSEIGIQEMYNDPIEPEPAAISIIQVPIQRLNEVGMDPAQFALVVQRTVAAGVRVGVVELEGTFEFAQPDETDNDTGFADLAGTIGGTLGTAVSGNGGDLPI